MLGGGIVGEIVLFTNVPDIARPPIDNNRIIRKYKDIDRDKFQGHKYLCDGG